MDRKAIKKTIDIHKKITPINKILNYTPKVLCPTFWGHFICLWVLFFYDITNLDTSVAIGLSASHQLISLKSKSFFH